MNYLAKSSIRHLESIIWLATGMVEHDLAIFEHSYDALSFGNFTLVIGNAHTRVRFTWRSQECVLTLECSDFESRDSAALWEHEMDISLPKGEGLFPEIAGNALDILAT